MVEAALVLSLSLILLMGMIEMGVALFIYQGMTECARRGARYSVVHVFDETKIKNVVVYGNSTGSGTPLFGLDPSMVNVSLEPIDNLNSAIRVVVQKPGHRFITPLFGSIPFSPRVEAIRLTEGLGSTG